jgi:hypothetical protein
LEQLCTAAIGGKGTLAIAEAAQMPHPVKRSLFSVIVWPLALIVGMAATAVWVGVLGYEFVEMVVAVL